jgi:hypothetical protein
MDWALIAAWRDNGVPLQVAIRGIDIAMDTFFAKKRPGSSKVNSLCYCHDSVMSEYASHLESHIGQSEELENVESAKIDSGNEADKKEILSFLSARICEIKALPVKHHLGDACSDIQRILTRLEELLNDLKLKSQMDSEILERDLRIIDELLIAELSALVSPEQKLAWEKEAKKELKVYKKRLPKETYTKIQDNFMRDKIHREFSIGELSIFHL